MKNPFREHTIATLGAVGVPGRDLQMLVKSCTMAYHFANGITSTKALAEMLDVDESLIRNWAKRTEYHEALDVLGVPKEARAFSRLRRDMQRENHQAFELANRFYDQVTRDGVPEHKRVAEVVRLMGEKYSAQRITNWIRRAQDNG